MRGLALADGVIGLATAGLIGIFLLTAIGCTPSQVATVSTVCADIAKVQTGPAAVQLAALDPHSALGVLWADANAGCVAGAPVAGVQPDWTGMVWGALKALAPSVLPLLIGLL
jgi:hypothetical protein